MFEPVSDKVIVQSTAANETTEGGIILPDIAQEDTMIAKVIAVGPGAIMIDGTYCNMQTKPGDYVVYPKLSAKKLEYKGEEYLIMPENEILTILTDGVDDE